MPQLTMDVAILGQHMMPPGILPVDVGNPVRRCLIGHSFAATMTDPARGISVDTSDCMLFHVVVPARDEDDLSSAEEVHRLFELALSAISDALLWTKSREVVGTAFSFVRQVVTTDAKAFFVAAENGTLVGWINPAFQFNKASAAMIAGFLSNMIVENGPSSAPLLPVVLRVMAAQDLINLGFYTESFVSLFSLADDLTQEVTKAGLRQKGFAEHEQKSLLRAIKEERLRVYLCDLAKLCGWSSLAEQDPSLFKALMATNTLRNNVMHGSRRMTRGDAIENSNVLLRLIGHLRTNPFSYPIPAFPELRLAVPHFTAFPPATGSVRPDGPEPSVELDTTDRNASGASSPPCRRG